MNSMKILHCILNNKWIKAVLLITVLQQLLVAGGTYFLGELVRQFPIQGFQLSSAIILFFCIFLPGTIVHYWIVWCSVRACKLAQLNYLNEYIQTNYNHPTHWRNEKSKQQRHDIMCRGGQETIQSTVYFFADLTATGLNIILNTISIILVTDLTLGIVIVLAGLSGLTIIYFSGTKIADSSRDEMLSENRLNAHMSRSWDNIVLGNQLFFDRWKKHFNDLFSVTEKASLEVVKKRDWAISVAGLITNGLVLGSAIFLAWLNQENAGFVLAILVMLPRSLQIVMHIQIIQNYVAQWKTIREKLVVTNESLLTPESIDLSSLIQDDNILIKSGEQNHSVREIDNLITNNKTGRFTITGPNGTGKSSLLLKLKNKFSLSATYLPAHHQLMLREAQLSLSTGEIALAALKDLEKENNGILFLDEWDANLSAENRVVLDRLIEQLSLERVVVEIRHTIDFVRV